MNLLKSTTCYLVELKNIIYNFPFKERGKIDWAVCHLHATPPTPILQPNGNFFSIYNNR